MARMGDQEKLQKKEVYYIAILLMLIVPFLSIINQVFAVFNLDNYSYVKLIIQTLIIVITLAISIQSWLVFTHLKTNHILYIGHVFSVIGLCELASMVLLKSGTDRALLIEDCVHMFMRLYAAIIFFIIITKQKKPATMHSRTRTYSFSLLVVAISLAVFSVLSSTSLMEQIALHQIDKYSHGLLIILQVVMILIMSKHLSRAPKRITWSIGSAAYLIVSDIISLLDESSNTIWLFAPLILQFLAYYFLLKVIHDLSVEKPYQQLLQAKRELEESQQNLNYQVYHDDLTQLKNENWLFKTLKEELQANTQQKALIAIEIERLVTIRSSIGISYANQMMRVVAERIQAILPAHYEGIRLREGCFVIYVKQMRSQEELMQFCQQVTKVMEQPLQVQLFSLNARLIMGIVLSDEQSSGEELLINAQLAMREARHMPQSVLIYQPEMSTGTINRLMMEQELQQALINEEFYLEYQPQVNLKTGKIECVEALVRWRHPVHGFMPPNVFIPIAEESGLIIPLGKWILERACTQVKEWEQQGLPSMKVAVNLSLGQLFQQDLVQMVRDILQRTDLDPEYLQLEITESMTMNIDQMTQLLHELKTLGIQIAVDDFGTGYSSLSYLKDFPIDCLKIDRAFVQNIQHDTNDKALVSMILSMAKHLHLKVVAEGIEEVSQLVFLINGDCDYIQGYLFSKPIAAEQISQHFEELHQKALTILTPFQQDHPI
ncbi:bifunctional diguanylate cyclase/phosphodiesterase [Lysinibacillus piscis]|uniref:EAL domain-containing protein n=1 Tax=Lysinibacillus piscis TaxID=2518931 RepID=A0ABQ5NJ01_9BACI|nr:EAL domain-containing protein [Lysinibacillus sp. KH24]GLC88345.1 hypothetical protein LYSBPC_14720 [Lysinibacillus sp. KH24]